METTQFVLQHVGAKLSKVPLKPSLPPQVTSSQWLSALVYGTTVPDGTVVLAMYVDAPVGTAMVETVHSFLHCDAKGENTPLVHVTASHLLPLRVQVQTPPLATDPLASHPVAPARVAVPVALPLATDGVLAALRIVSAVQCAVHVGEGTSHTPESHVDEGDVQV